MTELVLATVDARAVRKEHDNPRVRRKHMNMQRWVRTFGVLAVLVTFAACGDDPEPPTAPSPPPTVTGTFSGTVGRNGLSLHNFTTQASGTVTVTLTTLLPDSELLVGMSLGTWNGTACQLVIVKTDAKQATVITGGVSTLGSLCVTIYDVGNIVNPISYEMTVVHP
jgi:hypothetical protein